MLLLTSISDLIQVVTGSAVINIEVHASWVDNAAGTITPGRTNTAIATATTTTVVASPGASTQRNVQTLNIRNTHATSSNAITVRHTDGTTVVELFKYTLLAGEEMMFIDGAGWTVYQVNGSRKEGDSQTGINLQTFTTPGAGTYTPTTGMKYCIAFATGPGGGAGGADTAAGGTGDVGVGGGGGAGGTAIGFFTAGQIGVSQATNVGTGGAGGTAAGGNGGAAGGNTTFGALLTGTTGAAGTGSASGTQDAQATAGGAGGAASGGTFNITGGGGGYGWAASCDGTTDFTMAVGGQGGQSFWGGPARQVASGGISLTTDATLAGEAGVAPGTGGGGGTVNNTATGVTGGAGANGAIFIVEFF